MVLGLILTLLGSTVAARAVRSGSREARAIIEAPVPMVTAAVIAVLYVAAVVTFGFYTASFLLMLTMPLALGFRQVRPALIVAVTFMTIVYLVFSVLLEKPLPREALQSLLVGGG
jgi:hypothetical protein